MVGRVPAFQPGGLGSIPGGVRNFNFCPGNVCVLCLCSVLCCLCSFSNLSVTSPTSQLILQPFCHFTYITAHSPTFPSLHLHHSSFSNPSVTLPMSQLILQPFHHFTYITAHPPTLPLLHLRHSSFSNPSFASPTSQALHLHHLVSCPCMIYM